MFNRILACFISITLLAACVSQSQQPTFQAANTPTRIPSPTATNTPTPTITPSPTITPTPTPLPMAGPITENYMTRLGKGWINDLTFSPNGKILSVASSIGVYLYQVETMELISFLSSDAFVTDTIFIDDKTLVTGESDGSTIVWDIEGTPKALETLQRTDPVLALGVSKDATILITEFGFSGTSGAINVVQWDRVNPENVNRVSSEYGYRAGYSISTNMLLLQTANGKIILVDTQRMRATATICYDCLAFGLSQDGEILGAVKGWDDKAQIALIDIVSQKEIARFKNPEPRTSSLAFSPDRKLLASASPTALNLWNVETATLVDTFEGALNVSFSPDGTLLASISQDGKLILRELPNGDTRFTSEGFTPISQVAFQNEYIASTTGWWESGSKVGRLLDYYFANSDTIFLRDISTGEIIRTFSPSGEDPFLGFGKTSLVFSPDKKFLASSWSDPKDTIIIFNVNTGEQSKTLIGTDPLAFSPDSLMLVTGTGGSQMVAWDVASGKALPLKLGQVPEKFGEPYKQSLAFSTDGLMIAILSSDVILRDISTSERIAILKSGLDPSLDFVGFLRSGSGAIGAFSPNGKILASTWLVATNDDRIKDTKGVIILWDVVSREKIAMLDGHSNPISTQYADSNPITALAFSPDGNLLVSGANDNTIIVWDAQSGSLLKVLEGHVGAINSLSFSADGKLLYSNAMDGTVIIWNIEQLLP